MQSRTAIDLACGIIMAQNQCSQIQALEILGRTSNTRRQKLHTLAQQIVTGLSGTEETVTYFEE